VRYKGELAASLNHLALVLNQRGNRDEACHVLERAIREEETALETNPQNPEYRFTLGGFYRTLANMLIALGKHEEAAQTAEKSFQSFIDICFLSAAQAADCTARCAALAEKDDKLDSATRLTRSKAYADQARNQVEQAFKRCPDNPDYQNNLAWQIANMASSPWREPQWALRLAKRAVELAPQNGTNWNTLGAAYYRAGNAKEAVAALQKSMDLQSGGDSFDFFFLAMAEWKLGEKDKARQWYDKAVAALPKTKDPQKELLGFQTEAATLLGIPFQLSARGQKVKSP
jgi:tetratricopeptide (TPR) repeat protein